MILSDRQEKIDERENWKEKHRCGNILNEFYKVSVDAIQPFMTENFCFYFFSSSFCQTSATRNDKFWPHQSTRFRTLIKEKIRERKTERCVYIYTHRYIFLLLYTKLWSHWSNNEIIKSCCWWDFCIIWERRFIKGWRLDEGRIPCCKYPSLPLAFAITKWSSEHLRERRYW